MSTANAGFDQLLDVPKKKKKSTLIKSIIRFQPPSMALSNKNMDKKNNGKLKKRKNHGEKIVYFNLINSIILPPYL